VKKFLIPIATLVLASVALAWPLAPLSAKNVKCRYEITRWRVCGCKEWAPGHKCRKVKLCPEFVVHCPPQRRN
jgi:hypothetical protein